VGGYRSAVLDEKPIIIPVKRGGLGKSRDKGPRTPGGEEGFKRQQEREVFQGRKSKGNVELKKTTGEEKESVGSFRIMS